MKKKRTTKQEIEEQKRNIANYFYFVVLMLEYILLWPIKLGEFIDNYSDHYTSSEMEILFVILNVVWVIFLLFVLLVRS